MEIKRQRIQYHYALYLPFGILDYNLRFVRMASKRGIRKQQLQPVQLINLARAGVEVYRGDIRCGEAATEFLYHALSGNVVRQACERLHARDARHSRMNELNHFCGKEPSLPGHISELDDIVDRILQFVDGLGRREALARV